MTIQRLQQVQKSLAADQALLVEDRINTLYFIDKEISAGRLIFTADEVYLFADGRYYQQLLSTPGVQVVLWTGESWKEFLRTKIPHIKRLEFSSTAISYARYEELSKEFSGQLIPIKNRLERIRCIKDTQEIQKMKEAAALGCEGFNYLCTLLKDGVTEKNLAAELEIYWRRHGAQSCAFPPIIAFGENSAYPHYRPGDRKLKKGDTVLIDIGVTLNNYHSDMTRVVFYGKPSDKMKEIYEIVQQAQEAAEKEVRSGITVGALDTIARDIITKANYGKNFSHGLGHGIGLDVHEIPSVRSTGDEANFLLEPGMFITIEPGIYIPEIGGVRIEDTVLVTDKGYENLTLTDKNLCVI